MSEIIKNIKGTKDILGDETNLWQFIESEIHFFMNLYGYDEIRTPKFENSSLFNRSIGKDTDIVSKEMYSWKDQGGNNLTLKPEVTASVVRAFIQHNLGKKNPLNKLYYIDSLFRRERPQKGRYRQFEQFGVEAIGSENPEQDAEIISLAYNFYKNIGVENLKLKINSIGSKESREKYKKSLKTFLKPNLDNLTSVSQKRFITNPLRILDTKIESEIKIIKNAPRIIDYLSDEDKEHFDKVLYYLNSLDIKYEIDNFLVRGLDYYCKTVFEIQSNNLGAQSALCGGGRYDYLIEDLGGKKTHAIGFAAGIERLILAMNHDDNRFKKSTDIFMVTIGEDAISTGLKISDSIRLNTQLSVTCDMKRRSLKAQMKEANKLNAKYSIIIGNDELLAKKVVIKDMNSGEQKNVHFDKINSFFK